MKVHGYTVKFCYHCNKETSHAIVEVETHSKGYVCTEHAEFTLKEGAD